ncbi:MAG: tetratricopeptide repeat protein [Pseudomonadota bacterium]
MALLQELKRRKVYRVGIAYLAASWIALQLADVMLENLDAPGWVFPTLLIVIVVGFPIALIIAWAFELTPDGIKRDRAEATPGPATRGQYLQLAIIVVLAVAVGVLVVDKFNGDSQAPGPTLERSLAVLPFTNRSANVDDAFFVDGMHDDILTQLAKLATMDKVISQRTAEAYRDTTKSPQQIADELGVAAVLTGSFQRAGDSVRINMQLRDARNDVTIWAESWDRELTLESVFATQTEITEEVVSALQGTLSDSDRTAIGSQQTGDREAYIEYRTGRSEMARRTAPALTRALGHFERAVELDPSYVLAWVGLADVHALRSLYDDIPMTSSYEPRRRAIDRALSLDPNSGEVLTALADLREDQGDQEAAEGYFLQAIAQSPNYPTARHWYSIMLREQGRFDEALVQMSKARDIDPGAPILAVAESGLLTELGRMDEADAVLLDGIRLNPDFSGLYNTRGTLMYVQGDLAESLRWVDEAVRLAPTSPDSRNMQCMLLAELAILEEAATCAEALGRDFPTQYPPGTSSADLSASVQQGRIEDFLPPLEVVEGFPEGPRVGFGSAYFLANDLETARTLIASARPELFELPTPVIRPQEITLALIVASLLESADELEKARSMLDEIRRSASSVPGRITVAEFADVMDALAQDDDAAAGVALRKAIKIGNIQNWWVFKAPVFEGALEGAEFAAAFEALEAEIARQRVDYEARPDLPPI